MSVLQTTSIPPRVRQVARLIRSMSEQERRWLIQALPELRQAPNVPAPQADLMAHFQPRLDALDGARPMTDADPFVGGLSVGEFFALPENEQARLWSRAHIQAENEIKPLERPVHPNALPAR
jgi:hypothetical protein